MKSKHYIVITVVLVLPLAAIAFHLWSGIGFEALRSRKPPFQIRYDMYYQSKVGAQQGSTYFADRSAMRGHVPGTVPRDGDLYTYTTWEMAEAELRNPVAGMSDVSGRGKNRYDSFCATCHSPSGQDTTEVVRRGMPLPPNLAGPNAKAYSDARLFHVISAGQNIMPGYADKLTPEDRWWIINYVRELQKAPLRLVEIHSLDTTSTPTTTRGELQ